MVPTTNSIGTLRTAQLQVHHEHHDCQICFWIVNLTPMLRRTLHTYLVRDAGYYPVVTLTGPRQ